MGEEKGGKGKKQVKMELKEEEKEEEEEQSKSSMTPWEQHSNVISIPRYDYKAPSSLLQRSHSAFLVTCTIKREKSATKEVLSIFAKYVGSSKNDISRCSERSDTNADAKRRKICAEEIDQGVANSVGSTEITEAAGGIPKDECFSSAKTDTTEASDFALSLVKLTKSGLLLLKFPEDSFLDTTDIVSYIFSDLESGTLKSPLWCHRIFPIQATCPLNEKELQEVVSKLVRQFVNDKRNKLTLPVKFAVGFNRRGTEESQVKNPKDASKNSDLFELLDRSKCFSVVAAAVKGVVSDSVVDLESPELSVLIELLPLSGVRNGSVVVGLSVLPQKLVSTKPRLCIKPLVSDKKGRNAS